MSCSGLLRDALGRLVATILAPEAAAPVGVTTALARPFWLARPLEHRSAPLAARHLPQPCARGAVTGIEARANGLSLVVGFGRAAAGRDPEQQGWNPELVLDRLCFKVKAPTKAFTLSQNGNGVHEHLY